MHSVLDFHGDLVSLQRRLLVWACVSGFSVVLGPRGFYIGFRVYRCLGERKRERERERDDGMGPLDRAGDGVCPSS